MSIAGEGQSGKSGSLVEMTRDLAVMAERAAVQGGRCTSSNGLRSISCWRWVRCD